MESRGPGNSNNVKTSQAYFFEGFISFFEDFSLTNIFCKLNTQVRISVLLPERQAPCCQGQTKRWKDTRAKRSNIHLRTLRFAVTLHNTVQTSHTYESSWNGHQV